LRTRKDFYENLIDRMLGVLWRQWSAAGVYASVQPCRRSIVDPEALVVATMTLGRFDPRLFDESVDWLSKNFELVNITRLLRIARQTKGSLDVLAASALWLEEKKVVSDKRITRLSEAGEKKNENEYLFRSPGTRSGTEDLIRKADDSFARFGFLRGEVRLRGYSREPDYTLASNGIFCMRRLFGVNPRADTMAFLVWKGPGNPNRIASDISLTQKGVSRVLDSMRAVNAVERKGDSYQGTYVTDRYMWTSLLGLESNGPQPRYFVWREIYSALSQAIDDWWNYRSHYEEPSSAVVRQRDITPSVFLGLHKGGMEEVKLPDVHKIGVAFGEDFESSLDECVRVLEEFTLD
jgi:hypothetical protein